MTNLLPVEEALRRILELSAPLGTEEIPFDRALGRVLQEEIRAAHDYPLFDRSLMDGYAVIAADLATVPRTMRVGQDIPAGTDPGGLRSIVPGTAARIMTGAPLPPGADAVLIVEETEEVAGERNVIRARSAVRSGANLARRGDDIGKGELLLTPGEFLGPGEIGVLAATGRTRVRVGQRPRVAVLSTGDELVEPHREPGPGRIRNSNGPLLAALTRRAGGEAMPLGIAPDDGPALRKAIEKGLGHDALLLSGGVSMGTCDLVGETLQSLGVEVLFERVAIKPGKPFTFGRRGGAMVFACPGNPVSSYVIFQVFIRPALRRLLGFPADPPGGDPVTTTAPAPSAHCIVRAELQDAVHQKPRRTGYYQARVRWDGDRYRVAVLRSSGSADFVSCARGNALAIVPSGTASVERGEMIDVLLLDDDRDR
jgi:molybdopterin molybdotransferase